MSADRQPRLHRRRQRGAALIVGVLLLALIGVSIILTVARPADTQADRDRRTERALAQAKAALIGFAAGVELTGPERPGDLPCPDRDDDGSADTPCSSESTRIGRLPWKTLGLSDLRDGHGERLWYAVSTNFKNNPRTLCAYPGNLGGCLNSDSSGTITVRDYAGRIVHDGTNPGGNPSGAIAVLIAPGAALTRVGATSEQDRSAAGRNDPASYLDATADEDNANFIDNNNNGFVAGPAGSGGNMLVNDRVAVITYHDLMPVLEKRVAREVATCLDEYAKRPANNGRYPWASDTSESAFGKFADPNDTRAGRVPDGMISPLPLGTPPPPHPVEDQIFTNTRNDGVNSVTSIPMEGTWPGPPSPCNLGLGYAWWTNWKFHVFYALADAFKPGDTSVNPACGSCLTIASPNGPVLGAKYFVVVAGKLLSGQVRGLGNLADPKNYLEGENVFGIPTADVFELRSASSTFNDAGAFR